MARSSGACRGATVGRLAQLFWLEFLKTLAPQGSGLFPLFQERIGRRRFDSKTMEERPMPQADECRTKAQECEEIARQHRELQLKQLWEDMANKWRQLAEKDRKLNHLG